MKLFSDRAIDYFRSASLDDRRYLLFNPVTKSKVTSEGEKVVTLLWDVLAAKGFEKNTYFCEVARLIGALPRLEGTVHVNVAQILKFMPNYMFNPTDVPGRSRSRDDPADDDLLLVPGPGPRRVSKIQFADWAPIYEQLVHVSNVARFYEQAEAFAGCCATAAPDDDQARRPRLRARRRAPVHAGRLRPVDPRAGGARTALDHDLVDQIFDIQIRDFSGYAIALHGKRAPRPPSRRGRWPPCVSPSQTPHASTASATRCRPATARTRCAPEPDRGDAGPRSHQTRRSSTGVEGLCGVRSRKQPITDERQPHVGDPKASTTFALPSASCPPAPTWPAKKAGRETQPSSTSASGLSRRTRRTTLASDLAAQAPSRRNVLRWNTIGGTAGCTVISLTRRITIV